MIGVAVPTPGGVGSYPRGVSLGRDDVLSARRTTRRWRAAHRRCTRFRSFPVILVGLVFMAQDGLSVGELQELAGEARDKEMPARR